MENSTNFSQINLTIALHLRLISNKSARLEHLNTHKHLNYSICIKTLNVNAKEIEEIRQRQSVYVDLDRDPIFNVDRYFFLVFSFRFDFISIKYRLSLLLSFSFIFSYAYMQLIVLAVAVAIIIRSYTLFSAIVFNLFLMPPPFVIYRCQFLSPTVVFLFSAFEHFYFILYLYRVSGSLVC